MSKNDMNKTKEMRKNDTSYKYSHENSLFHSNNEYANTFSRPKIDTDLLDNSREIKISDDMKRNLNNVMEEDSQYEHDEIKDHDEVFKTQDRSSYVRGR